MSGQILISEQDRIKTLTISKPGRKNAIDPHMSRSLLEAMRESAEDDSRVIILTGEGEDFCAGADLDPKLLEGGFDVTGFLKETYNPLVLTMREMNKPIIARVQGTCVGVGFNFALACDLVYAAEDARFSQIFTQIGLSSDGGGAYFMWERLGRHQAFELMATHKIITAPEAEALGLINRMVLVEELDEYVQEVAHQLATGPYLAIKNTKANLRVAERAGLAAAMEAEATNQGENFASQDFLEGIAAFLQKRKPRWKGE